MPLLRWDLAHDRRTMRAEWQAPEGVLTTLLSWGHPATEEEVAAALKPRPFPRMAVGESRSARRVPVGPRALVVGWLRHAYTVKVTRR